MKKSMIILLVFLAILLSSCVKVPPVEYNKPCGYLNSTESVRCACDGQAVTDCPFGNCTETHYYCQGTCGECTCYQKDDMGDFYFSGNLYDVIDCSVLKAP